MRSGSWPTGPALIPSARVTLAGAAREVESVSVTRELPRVLPGQVASVGGVTAATGSVEWAQDSDATQRVGTPWTSKAYPAPGAAVDVWASQAGAEHKIFTGIADGSSSSFSDPTVSSSLVDNIDQLNKVYSSQALAVIMPPRLTTGGARRVIGLHPHYVTTSLLRVTNFMVTPNRESNCVISAPLTGSTWPEWGSLETSRHPSDVGAQAATSLDWSYSSRIGAVAAGGLTATYLPVFPAGVTGVVRDEDMQITACFGETQTQSGYVAAQWANGWQHRLGITPFGTLVAQIWDGSTLTEVCRIEGSTSRVATLRVVNDGTQLVFEIRNSGGQTATGTTTYGTSITGNPIDKGVVYAPESQIAGFQISFPTVSWQAIGHTRKLVLSPPDSMVQLNAIPALVAENVLDLLTKQSEAECAAFWIDEDGVLQWRSRTRVTAPSVSRNLTATEDLLEVKLRSDAQDTRAKVTVTYRSPAAVIAQLPSIELYEGSRDELQTADFRELIIAPGQDEDWIQLDGVPVSVFGDYNADDLNRGIGTIVGMMGLDEDGDEIAIMNGDSPLADWSWTFDRISSNAFRHTLRVNSLPTGVDRVTTSTRSEGTAVKAKYKDRGLPLVRGMGKLSWADKDFTSATTGPAWAPELAHDLSWFVQNDWLAQTIADWIAGQVTKPQPVVESVEIIPDPRIQLGDKVVIDDPVRTGVRLTGIVIGITQTISAGDHTMSLRLLVTLVETPNVTLAEFDAWYAGMTLDQVDALFAGSTLEQIDAAPLR